MSIIQKLIASLKTAWATEPTRIIWAASALVVFLAAKFGVIVPQAGIAEALALLLPFLLGAAANRSQVRPKELRRRPADRPPVRTR